MLKLAILGSTGSIGSSAIDVVRQFPGEFCVSALSVHSNTDLLERQIKEFSPRYACVTDEKCAKMFRPKVRSGTKLFVGSRGLEEMMQASGIDRVLVAISGGAALMPVLKAIESGKDIALANKEALVMAGDILINKAKEFKVRIIPVDSEQSAIWQCLNGQGVDKLKNIYLTASGGPFRKLDKKKFKDISIKQVLKHPRWRMGKKITVDSATLMNKGLEVLEAVFLFNTGADKIKVLIHPEAIIHSMVGFVDGVIMAQLSVTDMRVPIQYALSYPQRLKNLIPGVDFFKLKSLNFEKPDLERFPCLGLAYQAAASGGLTPAVLNAANEVSVEAFLKRKLDFISIPRVIENVLGRHKNITDPALEDILEADTWARKQAERVIDKCCH